MSWRSPYLANTLWRPALQISRVARKTAAHSTSVWTRYSTSLGPLRQQETAPVRSKCPQRRNVQPRTERQQLPSKHSNQIFRFPSRGPLPIAVRCWPILGSLGFIIAPTLGSSSSPGLRDDRNSSFFALSPVPARVMGCGYRSDQQPWNGDQCGDWMKMVSDHYRYASLILVGRPGFEPGTKGL